MKYPRLAHRIWGTPVMMEPRAYDTFVASCQHLFGLGTKPESIRQRPAPEALTSQPTRWSEDGRYQVAAGGVAILDVQGVLVHRDYIDAQSHYFQGYEGLARSFEAALADEEVEQIVLMIDSPGGEISGVFDLAERIYLARAVKPIHAAIADFGASAAYLIASAASEISLTPTGTAGSIGVFVRHFDHSGLLEQTGVAVTHIFAGARKVDGNPFEPLSEEALAGIQADVDNFYDLFVADVARNRGLSEDAVRATEAATYLSTLAVDAGLVDHIETPDELLQRLAGDNQEDDAMLTRASRTAGTSEDTPAAENDAPTPAATGDTPSQPVAPRPARDAADLERRARALDLREARLEVNERLDALGTRVNLGMRHAGLPELLAALSVARLDIQVGSSTTPALEVLFSALGAIPEFEAATVKEIATPDADAGAPSAADPRTAAERKFHAERGLNDERIAELDQKYGMFGDSQSDDVN